MKKNRYPIFAALRQSIIDDGWRTPDTYCNLFAEIKPISAVYLLMGWRMDERDVAVIGYIGMSKNLLQRLTGHSVVAEMQAQNLNVTRWFKPIPADELRSIEASYIHRFDPPWNIAGRRRGLRHVA